MRVLAFAASSSRDSINRALVRHAAERLRAEHLAEVGIEEIDLGDYEMPIYSIDREREGGIPEAAHRFHEQIAAADGLMISFAEHNGFFTAAYKNLFDWASRIDRKVFQGKPVAALAASIGPRGARNVLKVALESAPHFGAEVVGGFSVSRFRETFDLDRGELTDADAARGLGDLLARFAGRLSRPGRGPLPGPGMWNQRYSEPFAAYGTEPNAFLRAVAGRVPSGPVLVIGAGEGRNAIFMAERGHDVTAMDQSAVGLEHAAALASERDLALETVVADLADFDLGDARWSGIVAVWTHLPPVLRARVHAACVRALQPGGVLVLEAYGPDHLALPGRGGPPVRELLFDADTARRELDGLTFELCQDTRRQVSEGRDHQGSSATTQVLAVRS